MLRPALLATLLLAAAPARGDVAADLPPDVADLPPDVADLDDRAAAPALCALPAMLDAARAGLADGSDAYRRYLAALLQEAALTLPEADLLDAVASERDPALLEVLGRALATRASHAEDPGLLQPLLDRAALDGDPALRAAAVRALRATGSVEAMAALGGGVDYALLVQDPVPEVRAAVADNLIAENRDVYGGRDARLTAAAVEVATAATDGQVAARVLAEIPLDTATPDAVAAVTAALAADDPARRAGAALALGSAPPGDGATARALVARYHRDDDATVRAAILRALARLGQASAIPTLRALRGVAPALDPELDLWLDVLGLELQEWHLILREKLRRAARAAQHDTPDTP